MAYYRVTQKQSGGGTQFADLLALASGNTAFNLSDAVLNTEATKIPKNMFRENDLVEEVNLANVTNVGDYAFYSAKGITKIYLPACTSIGANAFQNTGANGKYSNGLIYLPECLSIGAEAFRGFQRQSQLMITLTKCREIGNNAFRGGSGGQLTTTLELPAIQTIGQYAIGEQTITTVDIGESCTYLNVQPFYNSTITNLIVRATTPPRMQSNLGMTPTHIYVPSDSVTTYQTASGWSTYLSIIEAIPT